MNNMKIQNYIFALIGSLAFCMLLKLPCSAGTFWSKTIGGATGIITTPSAKTAWEDSNFAIDATYHLVVDDIYSHIPGFTITFLKQVEIGFVYDYQGAGGDDWIIHTKWNFYNIGDAALAVGANTQLIKFNERAELKVFGQVYLVMTYLGNFFSMPVQTSLVFGKTLGDGHYNSDLDVSIGIDIDIFPDYINHYLHWINDFGNYSYSVNPHGNNYSNRGCFNTGLRIAALHDDTLPKLNIHIFLTDVFDESDRSVSLGISLGYAFL